ncbi:hypothetical protein BJ508DRAFT_325955 [Ascobolus immersus RN42]|uniref:Uncharacterized protein n=1 Tax=Ascobolus immersus RN42 TaxID=1160509 RepID=A0A3N4I773_ASCIM|nr:hypothetical protein BJ508DRAFT_325955 [Ascobolus immersus RN42]
MAPTTNKPHFPTVSRKKLPVQPASPPHFEEEATYHQSHPIYKAPQSPTPSMASTTSISSLSTQSPCKIIWILKRQTNSSGKRPYVFAGFKTYPPEMQQYFKKKKANKETNQPAVLKGQPKGITKASKQRKTTIRIPSPKSLLREEPEETQRDRWP